MGKSILILFAHPRYEDSVANRALLEGIAGLPGVELHDLYELYPDFDIDIAREQALLLQHQVIVWQHPFYWYSGPPLLKQWIDLVLAYGWAYGKGGTQLAGKQVLSCITAGGSEEVYQASGRNRYRIREFLYPFEQTARLCGMDYLPPFVVHQANRISQAQCGSFAEAYRRVLAGLAAGQPVPQAEYINGFSYPSAG